MNRRRRLRQWIARKSIPILGIPAAFSVIPVTKLMREDARFDVEAEVLGDVREQFEFYDEAFYGKPFTGAIFYHHVRDIRLNVREDRYSAMNREIIEFAVRRPRMYFEGVDFEITWVNRAAARFVRWRFPYWRNEP